MKIKFKLLSTSLLSALFILSGSSAYSDNCDGVVVNNRCLPTGPFDVSFYEYNQGIESVLTYDDHGNFRGVEVRSLILGSSYAFIDGLQRYAEEMTEWYEHLERQDDEDYVDIQNLVTNDEYAFAMVYGVAFAIDADNDGTPDEWFQDGDIISGSDWDNNGLIDVFENDPLLRHTSVGSVRLLNSTQIPSTNPSTGGGNGGGSGGDNGPVGDECEQMMCI